MREHRSVSEKVWKMIELSVCLLDIVSSGPVNHYCLQLNMLLPQYLMYWSHNAEI